STIFACRADRKSRRWWRDDRDCVGHALGRPAVGHAYAAACCCSGWDWLAAGCWRKFRTFVRRIGVSTHGVHPPGVRPFLSIEPRAERPADVGPSSSWPAGVVRRFVAAENGKRSGAEKSGRRVCKSVARARAERHENQAGGVFQDFRTNNRRGDRNERTLLR